MIVSTITGEEGSDGNPDEVDDVGDICASGASVLGASGCFRQAGGNGTGESLCFGDIGGDEAGVDGGDDVQVKTFSFFTIQVGGAFSFIASDVIVGSTGSADSLEAVIPCRSSSCTICLAASGKSAPLGDCPNTSLYGMSLMVVCH